MKYLHIHNVSIHINFYQNRFINECVMKTFLKFPYRRKDGVFVRCRRTSPHSLPCFSAKKKESWVLCVSNYFTLFITYRLKTKESLSAKQLLAYRYFIMKYNFKSLFNCSI